MKGRFFSKEAFVPAFVVAIIAVGFLFFRYGVDVAHAVTASDDFNRADGALGANWTAFSDGALTIASQTVEGTVPASWSGAIRTAETYTSNQYSEIQVTATQISGNEWIGAGARIQNAGADLYVGIYWWQSGTPVMRLYKRVGGVFTLLGEYASGALPAGTKLRVVAIGNAIFFLQDGIVRVSAFDSSLTGGAPGVMIFDSPPMADNWTGGDTTSLLSADANGVESYYLASSNNTTSTFPLTVRVLRPTSPAAGMPHNFLYALPVESYGVATFGNGMNTLRGLGAQNAYNVTIIEPSFAINPWYADNPNDATLHYETYMATDLAPWVTSNFATTGFEQHWLLGFSKSGFGAMDLLLKHPSTFTLAAAWDFPADMSIYNQFSDSAANYGTDASFQSNYRLTSAFVDAHKTPFLTANRIWISGFNAFQTDIADFDTLLTTAGVLHTNATGTLQTHSWDGGWVPGALAGLHSESVALPDTTAPNVTTFTMPAAAASTTVSVTSFTATDNIGVTGYLITETSTTPSAGDAGWSASAPSSHTFAASSFGSVTLFAWAKDAASNISASASATLTLNVPPHIVSFGASPASITAGNSAALSWSVTNASSITVDPGSLTSSSSSGSFAVSPSANTTYTLTATNSNGTSTAAVTVSVAVVPAQSAPPPTVAVSAGGIYIKTPPSPAAPPAPLPAPESSSVPGGAPSEVSSTVLRAEVDALVRQLDEALALRLVRNIGIGSFGSDVTALQIFLNANGYPLSHSGPGSSGRESTYFGPLTKVALERFQTARGVPATGFFGPLTRAAVGSF